MPPSIQVRSVCSCDLGISLKSFGIRCGCSVALWLTDGPSSCSILESTTNQGAQHSGFLEILEIGQESEDNGLTSFEPVPGGRREGPVPLHSEITRVWPAGRRKSSLAKVCLYNHQPASQDGRQILASLACSDGEGGISVPGQTARDRHRIISMWILSHTLGN